MSYSIKKLETSIDIKLFLKKGKELLLTEAGIALFNSCKTIFYEIEKVSGELNSYKENPIWKICVGSTVEFGTTILVKHMENFLLKNPDIHLDFYFSHNLSEPLLKDDVDLIIDCVEHELDDVEKIPLFREQYVVIASPKFIENHKIKELNDLERIPILSMDKEHKWLGNFLSAIDENNRPQFKNVIQINHIRGLINGAISGLGVSFVPKYTVINELKTNVLIDPFPFINPKVDNFNIYLKKHKNNMDKISKFINYLVKIKPSEFGGEK